MEAWHTGNYLDIDGTTVCAEARATNEMDGRWW
jgi:hypothetical protein